MAADSVERVTESKEEDGSQDNEEGTPGAPLNLHLLSNPIDEQVCAEDCENFGPGNLLGGRAGVETDAVPACLSPPAAGDEAQTKSAASTTYHVAATYNPPVKLEAEAAPLAKGPEWTGLDTTFSQLPTPRFNVPAGVVSSSPPMVTGEGDTSRRQLPPQQTLALLLASRGVIAPPAEQPASTDIQTYLRSLLDHTATATAGQPHAGHMQPAWGLTGSSPPSGGGTTPMVDIGGASSAAVQLMAAIQKQASASAGVGEDGQPAFASPSPSVATSNPPSVMGGHDPAGSSILRGLPQLFMNGPAPLCESGTPALTARALSGLSLPESGIGLSPAEQTSMQQLQAMNSALSTFASLVSQLPVRPQAKRGRGRPRLPRAADGSKIYDEQHRPPPRRPRPPLPPDGQRTRGRPKLPKTGITRPVGRPRKNQDQEPAVPVNWSPSIVKTEPSCMEDLSSSPVLGSTACSEEKKDNPEEKPLKQGLSLSKLQTMSSLASTIADSPDGAPSAASSGSPVLHPARRSSGGLLEDGLSSVSTSAPISRQHSPTSLLQPEAASSEPTGDTQRHRWRSAGMLPIVAYAGSKRRRRNDSTDISAWAEGFFRQTPVDILLLRAMEHLSFSACDGEEQRKAIRYPTVVGAPGRLSASPHQEMSYAPG